MTGKMANRADLIIKILMAQSGASIKELSEHLALQEVLQELPAQDRALIRLRFFGGKTQSETARLLHTTQVQVSRRERKILLTLRGHLLK